MLRMYLTVKLKCMYLLKMYIYRTSVCACVYVCVCVRVELSVYARVCVICVFLNACPVRWIVNEVLCVGTLLEVKQVAVVLYQILIILPTWIPCSSYLTTLVTLHTFLLAYSVSPNICHWCKLYVSFLRLTITRSRYCGKFNFRYLLAALFNHQDANCQLVHNLDFVISRRRPHNQKC